MKPTNILAYRITRPINLDYNKLATQLAEFKFVPCESQDICKYGWVSPMGKHSDQLLHVGGDWIILTTKKQEKIIPSSVIDDELTEKVAILESEKGCTLKRTEKATLKDEIIMDLLPKAFSRNSKTNIWICTKLNIIFVDVSSYKKAEDQLALLRKTIGSLPVVPVVASNPIAVTMTEWIKYNTVPTGFTIGEDAELKQVEKDGAVLRCKQQDLSCSEILSHIDANKFVTKLAINWQDRIDFILNDDFSIKRCKFSDELTSQNQDINHEDHAQRFDADMVLFAGEFSAFLPSLFSAIGGIEVAK
ncbi:recombination-associated protein RdgC [Photobacterium toruni]|uniref:Recombination-associated protein RdgC n=1 Tax=Photobacterium toruni TaxID=1935446 RepID=A0A1T4UJM1_9GAMM|nr:recombination-associated protein RdgC [Photobacterium toruni]SKA52879.1 Recombination-associated protein RdgC [Photobacterium toruni]